MIYVETYLFWEPPWGGVGLEKKEPPEPPVVIFGPNQPPRRLPNEAK